VRVLVVNAGSSSLKLSLLGPDDALLWTGSDLGELQAAPDAVGHRVVHGGDRFVSPVRLDDATLAALHDLTELAPLHQPKSLAAIEAVSAAYPDVPAVACFDTAFHATLPPSASTYALPAEWRSRYGVRRYGFHGLSHAYASRQADGASRVVTCHLGAGASLCAVLDGRSVDTTMGFTPLEGLVMATRSGSVDPGLLLWLQQHEGVSVDEMADALDHSSGLAGLAGTSDMREVLARAESGDADARLAFDVYVHRLRAGIGAMAASLGGLDALVFTGGVGERSAPVRAAACSGLGFLGVAVDSAANDAVSDADADVTAPGATARVLVVHAREDLEIAAQTRAVLGA
jgi:acetate kinase